MLTHQVALSEAETDYRDPIIRLSGLLDAHSLRPLHDGDDSGVGGVFAAMIRASGRVAQISVVLVPAAGGAAYGPDDPAEAAEAFAAAPQHRGDHGNIPL